MNLTAADRIAKAVLYEGYMLYPYRPSAVKNQQRFNFGVVYPQAFSERQKGTDPWTMQSECLVLGSAGSVLEVRVRFLQLVDRSIEERAEGGFRAVKALDVGERSWYSWQEAVEHEVSVVATDLESLSRSPVSWPVQLSSGAETEPIQDKRGEVAGRIVRTQYAINASVQVAAHGVAEQVYKIDVRIGNTSELGVNAANREFALMRALVSTHFVLGVGNGEFVSLLDPPETLRGAAEDCHNQGVFPVLVGEEGQRDTMLASHIILYDFPQIAAESAGDLFDGTEIDEILSLRIMTMTDEEKREMRDSDERARKILERTENLPAEQFMKLHGAVRGLRHVNGEMP
jgi:hydrogenase maturation protease